MLVKRTVSADFFLFWAGLFAKASDDGSEIFVDRAGVTKDKTGHESEEEIRDVAVFGNR